MRPQWVIALLTAVLLVVRCSDAAAPEDLMATHDTLPPPLIEVSHSPGETVRTYFRACATFDISDTGMGADWRGSVWFEIGGVGKMRQGGPVDNSDAPTRRSVCLDHLWPLYERVTVPDIQPVVEGPVDLSLAYRDASGQLQSYTWQVQLQFSAPQAPPEVLRIREVHALFRQVEQLLPALGPTTPGYGDYQLNLEQDLLTVYLGEESDRREVEEAIAEVFGADLPSGGLRFVKPEFEPRATYPWQRRVRQAIWRELPEAYSGSGYSARWNRILYWVRTPYIAHRARQVVAKIEVPQEAVTFYVPPSWAALDDPPPRLTSPLGVTLSLDFEPSIRMGEALLIEVTLKNSTDAPIEFGHTDGYGGYVFVFTAGGDLALIYTWDSGEESRSHTKLEPGEEVRLMMVWDLTDRDGFALPPGTYLIRAAADPDVDLATEPHELRIEP